MKVKIQVAIIKNLFIILLVILGYSSCKEKEPVKSITIIQPDQSETYTVGDTISLKWESSAVNYVKIELLIGGAVDREIDRGTSNIGFYEWSVLGLFEARDDYKIRVSDVYDSSIYDDTDNALTITNVENSIYTQVITPNGGETWSTYSSHTIQWTTNYTGLMRVYLIYNEQIYAYITGTGTTDTIMSINFSGCDAGIPYKIRVCSATDYTLYGDESDGYFYLTTPVKK